LLTVDSFVPFGLEEFFPLMPVEPAKLPARGCLGQLMRNDAEGGCGRRLPQESETRVLCEANSQKAAAECVAESRRDALKRHERGEGRRTFF
jgi:hypothetical protein